MFNFKRSYTCVYAYECMKEEEEEEETKKKEKENEKV
jgi:hypothetical protein